VQSGDTLHSIAEQFYGDPGLWSIIAEANNLADADSIAVGTQLTIPPHP
jgi:nucleoid-associated protein YgaU